MMKIINFFRNIPILFTMLQRIAHCEKLLVDLRNHINCLDNHIDVMQLNYLDDIEKIDARMSVCETITFPKRELNDRITAVNDALANKLLAHHRKSLEFFQRIVVLETQLGKLTGSCPKCDSLDIDSRLSFVESIVNNYLTDEYDVSNDIQTIKSNICDIQSQISENDLRSA